MQKPPESINQLYRRLERIASQRGLSSKERKDLIEGVSHRIVTRIMHDTGAKLTKKRRDNYAWIIMQVGRTFLKSFGK